MKKIGFVVPWFSKDISGGAEMEVRDLTLHLRQSGVELEILTTCVEKFQSDWNVDYFPEGIEIINGIATRRFKIRKRNTQLFDMINLKLMANQQISEEEEKIFCEEMINSPDLYKYIADNENYYSLFVFIPYMFGTTFYGCQVCPDKSVLITCLHDESYAHMKIFKKAFSNVRGIILYAQPEYDLANKLFDLKNLKAKVLGAGVNVLENYNEYNFRKKYNINFPYIMYAGRKDEGKNVHTLIKYFVQFKKRNSNNLKLILIGGGHIDIPNSMKSEILDLGFISLQDKFDAYAGSLCLCNPSKFESFSLVIMESWYCKRPVLVSEDCNVTSYFVKDSNGGLYFKDYFDFEGAINFFLDKKDLAAQMGRNGCEYVKSNFDWNIIIKKYQDFFEELENNCNDSL